MQTEDVVMTREVENSDEEAPREVVSISEIRDQVRQAAQQNEVGVITVYVTTTFLTSYHARSLRPSILTT